MKKSFAVLFFIILLSFSTAFADHAEDGFEMYYGVINSDNVILTIVDNNHHEEKNNLPKEKHLNSGDIVYVRMEERYGDAYGKISGDAEISWVSLNMFDEIYGDEIMPINFGYIDSKYIDKLDDNYYSVSEAGFDNKLVVINPNGADIFESHSEKSKLIGNVPAGTVFYEQGVARIIDLTELPNYTDYEEEVKYEWLPYGGGFIKASDLDFAEHDLEYLWSDKGLIVNECTLEDGTILHKYTEVEIKIYDDLDGMYEKVRILYNGNEYDISDIENSLFYSTDFYWHDPYFVKKTIFNNYVSNIPIYDGYLSNNIIGYLENVNEISVLFKREFNDSTNPAWVCIRYNDSYGFINLTDNTLDVKKEEQKRGDDYIYVFNINSYETSNNSTFLNNDSEETNNDENNEETTTENSEILSRQKLLSPDKKIMIACSCATFVAVIAVIILIVINKKH